MRPNWQHIFSSHIFSDFKLNLSLTFNLVYPVRSPSTGSSTICWSNQEVCFFPCEIREDCWILHRVAAIFCCHILHPLSSQSRHKVTFWDLLKQMRGQSGGNHLRNLSNLVIKQVYPSVRHQNSIFVKIDGVDRSNLLNIQVDNNTKGNELEQNNNLNFPPVTPFSTPLIIIEQQKEQRPPLKNYFSVPSLLMSNTMSPCSKDRRNCPHLNQQWNGYCLFYWNMAKNVSPRRSY